MSQSLKGHRPTDSRWCTSNRQKEAGRNVGHEIQIQFSNFKGKTCSYWVTGVSHRVPDPPGQSPIARRLRVSPYRQNLAPHLTRCQHWESISDSPECALLAECVSLRDAAVLWHLRDVAVAPNLPLLTLNLWVLLSRRWSGEYLSNLGAPNPPTLTTKPQVMRFSNN